MVVRVQRYSTFPMCAPRLRICCLRRTASRASQQTDSLHSVQRSSFSSARVRPHDFSTMPRKDTGAAPTPAEPPSPAGSWSDGTPFSTGSLASSTAAAAPAAEPAGAGLAAGASAHASGGAGAPAPSGRISPKRAQPAKPADTQQAALDSIAAAISALTDKLEQGEQRFSALESRLDSLSASRAASEHGGGGTSTLPIWLYVYRGILLFRFLGFVVCDARLPRASQPDRLAALRAALNLLFRSCATSRLLHDAS